jgi:hypothetical protein
MTIDPKPYHEMSLKEYVATAHSQIVPRWSVLAIPPDGYSVPLLCRFSSEQLRALAFLWGVNQDGSKQALAERIIRRHEFRVMLSQESEESLARKSRPELANIAREAGVFHSWLNRRQISSQLVQWRSAGRNRARMEIAKARHERVVRQAARNGFYVPPENLEKYGLDAHGNQQPTIWGVSLSLASRVAPEAIAAAKSLSQDEFVAWIRANPAGAGRLMFIEVGILGDGGTLFWKLVQKAFTPAPVPPLFAGSLLGDPIE